MFVSLMLGCQNTPSHRTSVQAFVQQLGVEFQDIALEGEMIRLVLSSAAEPAQWLLSQFEDGKLSAIAPFAIKYAQAENNTKYQLIQQIQWGALGSIPNLANHEPNRPTPPPSGFRQTISQRIESLKPKFLSAVDLSGVDLIGANLRGVDLRRTNLSAADLSAADLSGANLIGANLTDANLSFTALKNAIINKATKLDPKWSLVHTLVNEGGIGATLSRIDLSSANLSSAQLSRARLGGASLQNVDFSHADLNDVEFSGSNLNGAYLNDANLANVNFTNAKLKNVDLSGANLTNANFFFADLSGANLTNANLTNANLKDAIVKEAQFTDSVDLSETNRANLIQRGALMVDRVPEPSSISSNPRYKGLSPRPARFQT